TLLKVPASSSSHVHVSFPFAIGGRVHSRQSYPQFGRAGARPVSKFATLVALLLFERRCDMTTPTLTTPDTPDTDDGPELSGTQRAFPPHAANMQQLRQRYGQDLQTMTGPELLAMHALVTEQLETRSDPELTDSAED